MSNDDAKVSHRIKKIYRKIRYLIKNKNIDTIEEINDEDYIYHDVVFGITDKFKTRYKK